MVERLYEPRGAFSLLGPARVRAAKLIFPLLVLVNGCAHCNGTHSTDLTSDVDLSPEESKYGPLPTGKGALLAESDKMVEKGPSGPSVGRSFRAAE